MKTSISIKKIIASEGSLPFIPLNKGEILPVFRPNMYNTYNSFPIKKLYNNLFFEIQYCRRNENE